MILTFNQEWMNGIVGFHADSIVAIIMARPPAPKDQPQPPAVTTLIIRNGNMLQPAQVSDALDKAVEAWDDALDDDASILMLSDPEGDRVCVLASEISHIDVGGNGENSVSQIRIKDAREGITVSQPGARVVSMWSDAISEETTEPPMKDTLWQPPTDLTATLNQARIDAGAKP